LRFNVSIIWQSTLNGLVNKPQQESANIKCWDSMYLPGCGVHCWASTRHMRASDNNLTIQQNPQNYMQMVTKCFTLNMYKAQIQQRNCTSISYHTTDVCVYSWSLELNVMLQSVFFSWQFNFIVSICHFDEKSEFSSNPKFSSLLPSSMTKINSLSLTAIFVFVVVTDRTSIHCDGTE